LTDRSDVPDDRQAAPVSTGRLEFGARQRSAGHFNGYIDRSASIVTTRLPKPRAPKHLTPTRALFKRPPDTLDPA